MSTFDYEAWPPDDLPEISVPAAFPALFTGPVDWDYGDRQRHTSNPSIVIGEKSAELVLSGK